MSDVEPIVRAARARARRLMPGLMARIDWPRARVDEFRERRLRETLAHAIEHSAWHRERLAGIDPGTFRLADVPSLPTMTKADLMGEFDRIATDPRVRLERCEEHIESGALLMDGELVVMASGGSTGVRALGVERVDDLAEAWASALPRFVLRWVTRTRRIPRVIVPLMMRIRARRGPPRMAGVGAAPGPHASHILGTLFGGAGGSKFSVVEPMARIVAGLNAAQPQQLMVYSSFLPRLLEESRQGRLRIRPKVVAPVAEPVLPEHEEAAREVWGCAILTTWGATEVAGCAASSGFDPGMLLCEDVQIVEPVDADGKAVPPGRRADKVFVTPLRTRVLPLIRYEITDQLTVLEEPATCGSSFTRIANVEGRLDDEFVYEGGIRVHPHLFRTVLGRRRTITEYQVEQTARGAQIRAVLAEGAGKLDGDRVAQEIREHLGEQGLVGADISVQVVPEIPRHAQSMKLRRFVPLASAGRNSATGWLKTK